MNNGDGLRVVVWISGCNHYCSGCFNPETWDVCGGDEFGDAQLGMIYEALSQDWCSGLTLTGGDPLFPQNREDVLDLCKKIKDDFPNKTIWLYTGFTYEEISNEEILNYVDVLVDGPFIKELADPFFHWRGSTNQKILMNFGGNYHAGFYD